MIVYVYECKKCGSEFDALRPLKKCDILPICPDCGSKDTRKIITNGGIQRDEPTWLSDAVKALLPDDSKPIASRCEFNRYLKEHNIAQK